DFPLSEDATYLASTGSEGFDRLELKGTLMNDALSFYASKHKDGSWKTRKTNDYIVEAFSTTPGGWSKFVHSTFRNLHNDISTTLPIGEIFSYNAQRTVWVAKDGQQLVNLPSRNASLDYWNLNNPTYKPF
ncbi:313_t:CDS:2, partial [Racocetra persica]